MMGMLESPGGCEMGVRNGRRLKFFAVSVAKAKVFNDPILPKVLAFDLFDLKIYDSIRFSIDSLGQKVFLF